MRQLIFTLTLSLLAPLGACKKEKAPAKEEGAHAGAVKASPSDPAAVPVPEVGRLSGAVVETMDSGGYTYMKLKTTGGEKWAAVSKSAVKVGQEVTISGPTLMKGFKSKSLERTFEEIYFGALAREGGSHGGASPAGKLPAGHPPTAGGGQKSGTRKQPVMDIGEPLKKAEGVDGRTIAEIFGQGKALADKKVSVRGKVVKINRGIMGRNWLHMQDGSGAAAAGTHDLTLTTAEDAKLGEVVVATGVVRVDKDFGHGYRYPVILEEVKLKR